MNTFCCIFLNLYSFNPDTCFLPTICSNFQNSIFSIRLKKLCYLIIFWRIRIKIIFSVKITLPVYLAPKCKCRLYRIIQHFFIQLRQSPRLPCTNRTYRSIRLFIIIIRITRTPYLRIRFQLTMHFQSNDCFIFHTHFLIFSLSFFLIINFLKTFYYSLNNFRRFLDFILLSLYFSK